MANVGIILAAGEATRLPNKPLLPLHGGKILIESALDLFKHMDSIVVVIREGSLLPYIGNSRQWKSRGDIAFIQQRSYWPGVGGAVHSGADVLNDTDNVCVAFCDNLYHVKDRELLDKLCAYKSGLPHRVATVRQPRQEHTAMLDYWSSREGKWCVRGGMHGSQEWALAGFLFAQAVIFKQFGDTMTGSLNRLEVRPEHITGDKNWRDLGTVDSYREYLLDDGE